jgi:two-component system phosphate regulon response regulator PhoB
MRTTVPIRVLVAEDDRSLAELLHYNLEAAGFAVTGATDGEQAYRIACEGGADLLLLDWNLPRLPGIEVCRRLRARPETARLPILMLTARTDAADRALGLATGADDFQSKPCSPGELVGRIRELVGRAGELTT